MLCFVHIFGGFSDLHMLLVVSLRLVTQIRVSTSAMKAFLRFRCCSHKPPGPPTFPIFLSKVHKAQGSLELVMCIRWYLSVPLYSILGTGNSTYSPGLLKLGRNLCGKRTCALLSCMLESACLCHWMACIATTADSDPTSNQP